MTYIKIKSGGGLSRWKKLPNTYCKFTIIIKVKKVKKFLIGAIRPISRFWIWKFNFTNVERKSYLSLIHLCLIKYPKDSHDNSRLFRVNDSVLVLFQNHPKENKKLRLDWCFYGSEPAFQVELAHFADISPPCEIPCKMYFRLHEKRVSPPKGDLTIVYPRSRLGGLEFSL